jgi:hypothetical protein
MREDGCVMPRRPTHGAEASSSRAILPAQDGTAAHSEQEREHVSAPPAHFCEAQAEQALRQEFRDHDASLNNALNEALQIQGVLHGVYSRYASFLLSFGVSPPLVSSMFVLPLTRFLLRLVYR